MTTDEMRKCADYVFAWLGKPDTELMVEHPKQAGYYEHLGLNVGQLKDLLEYTRHPFIFFEHYVDIRHEEVPEIVADQKWIGRSIVIHFCEANNAMLAERLIKELRK